MTAEDENNESAAPEKQSNRLLWLIAAFAVLLYTLTLSHWVTLSSLPLVSKICGWDWHPTYLDWRPTVFTPFIYLITYPCRWLPSSIQPVGMNAISMIFAVLTLVTLARSVRILPHDRTRDQRSRHLDSNGLMTDKDAVLPMVLAVCLCGFQITFWENAVTATGEMISLFVFAWLIRCLLEYRISQKEGWLTQFCILYGASLSNNWAMIGFLPLFVIAFIWFKGLPFFRLNYFLKVCLWGCIGLCFYLMMPLVGSLSSDGDFFHLLHQELVQQKLILMAVPRWVPILLSFPTIIALFFIGIRWPQSQGDVSAVGSSVTNIAFHFMHLVFLVASVWIFFDLKYSPRSLEPRLPMLTFYYMAALSAGYFLGYAYLIYGRHTLDPRFRPTPSKKSALKLCRNVLTGAVVAVAGCMAWNNVPKIKVVIGPELSRYAAEMVSVIPQKGAVVLSDNVTHMQLYCAACQQAGKPIENILMETRSLVAGDYLRYLIKRYPQLRTYLPSPEKIPDTVANLDILQFMEKVGTVGKIPLYYLHPSFGYFFERYYARPMGIVYELEPYTTKNLNRPPLTVDEVNFNQQFWTRTFKDVFINIPDHALLLGKSSDAETLGWFGSVALNCWGVELQKNNRIKEAAERFSQAIKLNPENHMAKVNALFNDRLREGNTQGVNTAGYIRDAMMKLHTWENILELEGPADEPDLQLRFGQAFAAGKNLRQAYQLFERRLTLRPNDFESLLALGKTYADMGRYDKAEEFINRASAQTNNIVNQTEVLRVKTLVHVLKEDWAGAEGMLLAAYNSMPENEDRIGLLVEYYRMLGINQLRMVERMNNNKTSPDDLKKAAAQANESFAKSLRFATNRLDLMRKHGKTGSPEEVETLLKVAQLEIQLERYNEAIGSLSVLLQRQPENMAALLNRAIAELQAKKYPEAKRDYLTLSKMPYKAFVVYYGLAEIAYQQKDKDDGIKNCKLYLKYAPTNTAEYKLVEKRLAEFQR